jgi:3-dehydroquinate dehydratase-2
MAIRLMVLNGPNLNLLGVREPHIYGRTTLTEIEASCRDFAGTLGASLSFHQSNHEGVLVDLVQTARIDADAIVINPAAFSFTSIALVDAIKAFDGPVVEVHISNIHARDELHRHSVISHVAKCVIAGAGPHGYILAIQAAAHFLGAVPKTPPLEPVSESPVAIWDGQPKRTSIDHDSGGGVQAGDLAHLD